MEAEFKVGDVVRLSRALSYKHCHIGIGVIGEIIKASPDCYRVKWISDSKSFLYFEQELEKLDTDMARILYTSDDYFKE